MRKFILSVICAAALAGCSYDRSTGYIASASNPVGNVAFSGQFRNIELPNKVFDDPLAIARHFVRNFPETMEGDPKLDIKFSRQTRAPERLTLMISARGYLDDSVGGEQWRIVVSPTSGGWSVVSAENRFKCQRGPNEGKWVIEPCP